MVTCLPWGEGHFSSGDYRNSTEIGFLCTDVDSGNKQSPSANSPGLPGSKWGRFHVTWNAVISKVRAAGGGFGVKVEENVWRFPRRNWGKLPFQRFFIKALVLILFFGWEGGLFVKLILHNWMFFLMLQSAWIMVSFFSYSKMCVWECVGIYRRLW